MWSNISAPSSLAGGAHEAKLAAAKTDSSSNNNQVALQEQNGNHRTDDGSQTNNKQSSLSSGGSPLMRYKHAVCSAPNGFIYIHGGRFGNEPLDDDVWRFDPHHNSWLQLETTGTKPPCLQEHTLVEHHNQLYLFGGQVSASNQENSFWQLDLLTFKWTPISMKSSRQFGAHLGPTNRRGHSAVIYRDSMYVFGGFEDFRGSSSQLWQFDLPNQRWELRNLSSISDCQPEPRHSHSAIVFDDSMYVYGGLSNLKPLGDLWRWSWRDKRWFKERTRGQSPGQLHGHSAIQAFGSMFVFGGERRGRPTRSLWRLNLSNLCWQKVRPKGPRPSPTTWHAAIANPLGMLDEANYIIEGGDCSALESASSLSDNCFGGHSGAEFIGHVSDEMKQMRRVSYANGRNRPIRTEMSNNNNSGAEPKQLPDSKPPTSGPSTAQPLPKSSSTQIRPKAGGKRKLRLSFLSRRNKTSRASSSSYELKQMQNSLSAANLLSPTDPPKRHSIGIATPSEQIKCEPPSDEAMQVDDASDRPAREGGAKILDNLDTDIKQMFEQALVESSGERKEDDGSSGARGDQHHHHQSKRINRDSMTQSQLSSCLASSRSTYKTAREHLGEENNSTMTLTGDLLNHEMPSELPRVDAAEGPYNRRDNRPKSEIVQSLADRADARIKHLYTPFFNHHHQSNLPSFSSTSPNGKVATDGQGFFDRPNHRDQGRSKRLSFNDKSKRHTIHQTMTYYNLYFAASPTKSMVESENENSSSKDAPVEMLSQEDELDARPNRLVRDDLSSSTIKGAASTSAALVGVRDGESSSGSQATDQLSGLLDASRNSSESRTLCQDLNSIKQQATATALPAECSEDNFELQRAGLRESLNQLRRREPTTASETSGDNTSLSFSVIAEFEEDDLLQYSGQPVDQSIVSPVRLSNGYNNSREEDELQFDNNSHLGELEDYQRRRSIQQQVAVESNQNNETLIAAHKSASSGYDSIHSSTNNTANEQNSSPASNTIRYQQPGDYHRRQSAMLEEDTGSSLSGASPQRGVASGDSQAMRDIRRRAQANRVGGQQSLPEPLASTTTTDSLAMTSSDAFESSISACCSAPSKSVPSSPRDHLAGTCCRRVAAGDRPIQRQQQHQRPIQRFMSFSKRKSKTRYWQLCMFVIGGKQGGAQSVHEPITIWRLYI